MDINPASVAISSAPAQPILDYVSSDGNICRVSLKLGSLFGQCTAKRLKIALMCNQTSDARRRLSQIAEVEVSLFHIPQLHGIEVSSLPKNIEECLNGLELARRSEETIWESSLTQQGADCTIPRRRMVRLKGYRLIAFNEITHAVQHIFELHKAVSLEDPEEIEPATPANTAATPSTSASTPHTGRASRASGHMRTMSIEDQEEPFAIQPNSWRLTFEDDGHERYTVDFFADTPECKAKWMRYLRPIIRGQSAKPIGPPPQWALMLRDLRQQQKAQEKVAAAASD